MGGPGPDETVHHVALHMSDIAIRLGRKITWDPAREQIANDAEASKMLDRPMRKPWTL